MQTTITKVVHKEDCKRVFKNYDMDCPRCVELANGAKPRDAWFTPLPVYKDTYKSCGHNNLNPSGYCITCGNGRDFS